MLTSAIRQQPCLFENIAAHWQKFTGSTLLLFSPEGKPLSKTDGSLANSWPDLAEQVLSARPVFLKYDNKNILTNRLVYNDQTLGYLVALETQAQYTPLLEWVADEIIARVVDAQAMQAMTDELIGAWDQLELIFRVTENLALTTDLKTILKSVLEEIQQVIQTEDAFIMLQFPDTLLCVTGVQKHKNSICSKTLLHNFMQTDRVILCNDKISCKQIWPQMPENVKNLLTTQFAVIEENVQAVMGLLNKVNKNFTAGDAKLLTALAQQVATIINNHITHQKLIVEERLSRELEIAAEIQESLLPTDLPQMGGLSMAVSSMPASEVGGDFYDFITLDDRHLTVVIGDVSGKGIPAAMLTSVARTMLRVEAMRGEPPHKIIQQANNILHPDLSRTDSFVTVFVATIDTFDGKISYASAGHPPAILWRVETESVDLLKATSLPVGVFDLEDNYTQTVDLQPGDTLVLYTDGITEAQSVDNELFGLNRLVNIIKEKGSCLPELLRQFIQSEISGFRQHIAWRDDATLLILKTLSQTEASLTQNISTIIKAVDFLYPADMDYLSEISQQISNTCREISGLPAGSRGDDFIYLIELAISEICTNIVKHAYVDNINAGEISGKVTLLSNGVQLDFYDQGIGFDPNTVPKPEADPNNLREGGYGLHIVRQIMDVVSYENIPGEGNHWHLIKYVPSSK